MKALSIRQPWAWLIVNGWKDIENRTWSTKVRGRILIHASKSVTNPDREFWKLFVEQGHGTGPKFEDFPRGGIVGSVFIGDCVSDHNSPWFRGPYGFILDNPLPLPFIAIKGALGFFDVSDLLLPAF